MKDIFRKLKLIPVVAIDDPEKALPLADSLCEAGLPVAEITLRTDSALKSITKLASRDNFLVGAGTVHSVEQAKRVAEAGAKFVITPGINPKTVQWCVDNSLPIFPGIATPGDLEMALEFGLEIVKFFPAEALGGVKMLKALHGPFRSMNFIPTGGINASNIRSYLDLPCVVACGGSWIVKSDLIAQDKFSDIKTLTSDALQLIS